MIVNNLFNKIDCDIYSTNFKVELTNISSLDQAQIIVLPENHDSLADRERNAWIINKLYREGDIILVESPLKDLASFFQTRFVSRKITLHGWDDGASDTALHQAKQPFYELEEKLSHLNYSGDQFEKLLKEAIEKCPCDEKKILYQNLQTILDMSANGRSVPTQLLLRLIRSYHEEKGELGEVHRKTFPIRQAELIKSCDLYSSNSQRRIFVIAGAAHVLLNELCEQQFINEGVQTFHRYLDTKRFVIFDYDRQPTFALQRSVRISLYPFHGQKLLWKSVASTFIKSIYSYILR